MNQFVAINVEDITKNVFNLLDKDWFLITAGNEHKFNTMTASWGGLGMLWNKPVAYIFVRPTRYTYQFTETSEFLTLSFFTHEYKRALNICGKYSGRDMDKIKESGLTPLYTINNSIYFAEASLVLDTKKIYYQDITPDNFLDKSIDHHYPAKDYHRMYVVEIVNCLQKQN